ncbi:MAG: nitrate reductase molybdenum cofactor assembly chaperone [Xanthobacteraceae bacterium]|nr:MAG: nitrate reductase molybdenum cofactor assembly chaperone [Xanthobacteraceae bacterium]
MKTLKVLSALLTYPTAEMVAAIGEMAEALDREALLAKGERRALQALLDDLACNDLFDSQERYLLLFDRTRSLSLHLFEHVHGESRDRGQAMVDLLRVYEESGFDATTQELPDFLPLFLEYASLQAPEAALELIREPAHVIAALAERLRKRQSSYEGVFRALLALSKAKPDAKALAALQAEPDPEPDDLEALDAAWEEEEVRFGPGPDSAIGGCGKEALTARLRHARRAVPTANNPLN